MAPVEYSMAEKSQMAVDFWVIFWYIEFRTRVTGDILGGIYNG